VPGALVGEAGVSQYDLSRPVLERLREAADIVAVIGEAVTLRKAGRNWLGLCPFHGEKTPSFNVSRDKGTFYCFGCKKGGDVIDFVMEYERASFAEAVERLAERFGVDLPIASPEARRRRDESTELGEVLEAAQALYARQVFEDRPRAFLERRGVSMERAVEFGLGFARPDWRALYDALHGRFSDRLLVAAGLVVEGDGGRVWDRFRDRVTIPIRSVRGKLIAFGGRTLGDDPAKYLNSPETALFSKGRVLFALDRAARAFTKTDRAIVVEGYFDCLALQAAGFLETVATLGTSLSEHHAKELGHRIAEVVLCFDGDAAGLAAARTALGTLLAANLKVRVLLLPDGLDPDEIVRRDGANGFRTLLDQASSESQFLVAQMGASRQERRDGLLRALDLVSVCPDPVRRFTMREELARAAEVPLEQLGGVASPRVVMTAGVQLELPPPGELALLRGLLHDVAPERRASMVAQIPVELIENEAVRSVLRALQARVSQGQALEISQLTSDIDDRDVRRLLSALEHEAPETGEERLVLIMRELWERRRRKRLAELQPEIQRAKRDQDQEALARLTREWHQLMRTPTN
jgi:DNA primase